MEKQERRQDMRLDLHFETKLAKTGSPFPVEGMIENVSQKGALIRTKHFKTFQLKDKVTIVFLVPSNFSGHDMIIRLSDVGVVIRIDRKKSTIAIKFDRSLRQFTRVDNYL